MLKKSTESLFCVDYDHLTQTTRSFKASFVLTPQSFECQLGTNVTSLHLLYMAGATAPI